MMRGRAVDRVPARHAHRAGRGLGHLAPEPRAGGPTMPVLEPIWHDIEYQKPGGTIERLARPAGLGSCPSHQTSIGRAALEFRRGLRERPYDAIITNSAVSRPSSVAGCGRRRRSSRSTPRRSSSTRWRRTASREHSPLMQQAQAAAPRTRLFEATMLVVATSRGPRPAWSSTTACPRTRSSSFPSAPT